jgi:hypothetical protein
VVATGAELIERLKQRDEPAYREALARYGDSDDCGLDAANNPATDPPHPTNQPTDGDHSTNHASNAHTSHTNKGDQCANSNHRPLSATDHNTASADTREPGATTNIAPHGGTTATATSCWQQRGGVIIFGLPISSARVVDGVEIQYFERVRLKRRGATIQIGLLGVDSLSSLMR